MKTEIKEMFQAFLAEYDSEKYKKIWNEQSKRFGEFWRDRILKRDTLELSESEIDEVLLILDSKARGSRPDTEAIASVMIPQGAWYRLFFQLRNTPKLSETVDFIIRADSDEQRVEAIDRLYELNKGNKNHLTGPSANAINTLIAAYDPFKNLSVVSLNHRFMILKCILGGQIDTASNSTPGARVVKSNRLIQEFFSSITANVNARTVSVFFYRPNIKTVWTSFSDTTSETDAEEIDTGVNGPETASEMVFYMEKQLEDFLIANWEKTTLGERLELIEENGKLVSQQYRTDIGIMDILARDRNDGAYVVIELKRNQSSDDTVGQVLRYMGWVDEHKKTDKPSRGIIIARALDRKLDYALRRVRDVQTYTYKVDFHLTRL